MFPEPERRRCRPCAVAASCFATEPELLREWGMVVVDAFGDSAGGFENRIEERESLQRKGSRDGGRS